MTRPSLRRLTSSTIRAEVFSSNVSRRVDAEQARGDIVAVGLTVVDGRADAAEHVADPGY
jgi:hypothetical protein